jgi:hypothetical protein
MTAICLNNGPSSIKDPLSAASQLLSPQALIALFVGAELDWFAAVAGGVGYLAFDILNICALDPPPPPVVDAARFASYFASTQGAQFVREDVTQWATNLVWHAYCKCDTGPQPVPPPPTPQPTGIQVNNPTGTSQPTGTACAPTGAYSETTTFDSNGNHTATLPGESFAGAPVTWCKVTTAWIWQSTQVFPITATIRWETTSGTSILGTSQWEITGSSNTQNQPDQTFQIPPGSNHWSLALHVDNGASLPFQYQISVIPYCNTPPEATNQPCCPPDPQLTLLINQVMQLEQLILTSLPKPFGPTVDSTVHANLSGNGRVAISPTAAGVRIEITSRPPDWPAGKTDPSYLFSIGFITPRAQGTALRGSRLVYDHQIYEYPYYVDEVDYALALGVTVRLIELVTQSA